MNTTILKKFSSRLIAFLTLAAIVNILGVGNALGAFWRTDALSGDEGQFKLGTGVGTYGTGTGYGFGSGYGSQNQGYYYDSGLNINNPPSYSGVTSGGVYSGPVTINFTMDNLKNVHLDNSLVFSAGNMTGTVVASGDGSHSLRFTTIADTTYTVPFTINSTGTNNTGSNNTGTNNTGTNNTGTNNTGTNNTGSNPPVINSVISTGLTSYSNEIEFGFTDDSEDGNAYISIGSGSSYDNLGSGLVSVVTGATTGSYTGYAGFTGLDASTTYNFRILVTDSNNNSDSYSGTFTTLSSGTNNTGSNNTGTNNTGTNNTGTNQTGTNQTGLDTMPDSFSFNSVNNAKLNTYYTSNSITVTGVNTGTTISITGGMYSVNSGSGFGQYTSSQGTVNSGDRVRVKLKSSNNYSTSVTGLLSIGSLTGSFVVTTMPIPATGDDDMGHDNEGNYLSGMMGGHYGVSGNNIYSPTVFGTDNLINNIVNNLFQSISGNNNNFLQTMSGNLMYYNTVNNTTIIRNNTPYYTTIFNVNSNNMPLSLPMFDSAEIQDSVNDLTKRILNEVGKRRIDGTDLDNVFSYYKDMMSAMKAYEDEQNTDYLGVAQTNKYKLSDLIDDYPVIKPSKKMKDNEFEYALSFMNKNGLTRYDSVDDYRPSSNLTRQEAAKFYVQFVENVLGKDLSQANYDNCEFNDIDQADSSLQDYIIKACRYGLMKGSNGNFNPDTQISKAEALTVLVRAMQDDRDIYQDEEYDSNDSSTPWYKSYYQRAYDNGWTNEDDYMNLDKPLSRYEAGLLMHRSGAR